MTSLKELLEEAAGDDPGTSDADLAAALRLGKQSVRRRRFAGVASTAVATALVAGGVWTVVPGAERPGTAPAPAASGSTSAAVSPTAEPVAPTATPRPGQRTGTGKTPAPGAYRTSPVPPLPARPVALVYDGKVRPGTDLVCGLKPAGWTVTVSRGPSGADESELIFEDPGLKNPGRYLEGSTHLRVRHARIYRENGRMVVEKYSSTWAELPHVRAGKREVVVAPADAPVEDGLRDLHMRMSSTQLIQVANGATGLGWDLPTLLRFAGSCRFAG